MVLATDFSRGARLALRRAQHLPYGQAAAIQLVHVMHQRPRQIDIEGLEAARRARVEREVATLRHGLDRLGRTDVRIHPELREGPAVTELVAASQDADLIVLGRRGDSNLRRFLLGSTAEQVAAAAPGSVLIVGQRPAGPYQHPLVALPPRPATRVLEAALRLLPGIRLDVVTAAHVPMESWLWGGWTSTREILSVRSATRKHARTVMEAELAGFRARQRRFRTSVLDGDPRRVLLDEAQRRKTDLLVLGTRRKAGRERLGIGSVAAQVMRSARCDVLLALEA